MKKIVFALLVFLFWSGAITPGFAQVPNHYVMPGQVFTVQSPGCTEGACSNFEWERKVSLQAWAPFAEGSSLSITDTLSLGQAARYRLRAYLQGYTCDENGCTPSGPRVYGAYSDASDWIIGFNPNPGTCQKPAGLP
jgi:hypothetical protein